MGALQCSTGPLLDTLADIKPQPGKQKLAQLCDLRDAAASALSNAGYIAGVTIPPQEINAGDATLIVIPARLVDVHITGSAGRFGRTLAARVDRLKAGRAAAHAPAGPPRAAPP